MIKEGIPYTIGGGTKFYDRKEIKDMLAYLRLAVNPRDEVSFQRVVNFPHRGVGKTTVDKIIVRFTLSFLCCSISLCFRTSTFTLRGVSVSLVGSSTTLDVLVKPSLFIS